MNTNSSLQKTLDCVYYVMFTYSALYLVWLCKLVLLISNKENVCYYLLQRHCEANFLLTSLVLYHITITSTYSLDQLLLFIWMFLWFIQSMLKVLFLLCILLMNNMQAIIFLRINSVYCRQHWRNHVAVIIIFNCICCLNCVLCSICETLCSHLDQDCLEEEILFLNGTFLVKERINKINKYPPNIILTC